MGQSNNPHKSTTEGGIIKGFAFTRCDRAVPLVEVRAEVWKRRWYGYQHVGRDGYAVNRNDRYEGNSGRYSPCETNSWRTVGQHHVYDHDRRDYFAETMRYADVGASTPTEGCQAKAARGHLRSGRPQLAGRYSWVRERPDTRLERTGRPIDSAVEPIRPPPDQPPRARIVAQETTVSGALYKADWLVGSAVEPIVDRGTVPWGPVEAVTDVNQLRLVIETSVRPRNVTVTVFGDSVKERGEPAGEPVASLDCWLTELDREPCRLVTDKDGHQSLQLPGLPGTGPWRVAVFASWPELRVDDRSGLVSDSPTWVFHLSATATS